MEDILGKPMLEHVIERTRRASGLDDLWVATTDDTTEGPILELCSRLNVPTYRGPVNDVLARYYYTAHEAKATNIVRITSDCPLIDPQVTGKIIKKFLSNNQNYDYVSNCQPRTYPRGLDTEIFSAEVLETVFKEAIDPDDREHVTSYITRNPDSFRLLDITDETDRSDLRLTVDTKEDLEFIRHIFEELYPKNNNLDYLDVIGLLDRKPDWCEINTTVVQKEYGQ